MNLYTRLLSVAAALGLRPLPKTTPPAAQSLQVGRFAPDMDWGRPGRKPRRVRCPSWARQRPAYGSRLTKAATHRPAW